MTSFKFYSGSVFRYFLVIGILFLQFCVSHHHENHVESIEIELNFVGNESKANVFAHEKVVVCYVGTWSTYRVGADGSKDGAFNIEDIDPRLCTHLIYSFAGLENGTFVLKPLDPYLDLEKDYGRGWYKKFNALKTEYPHLKVLLAIGGWNEGSQKYSLMAADEGRRKTFIDSALDLIRQYGFDGLDLDWEFPGSRGGRPEDKKHFTLLVKELRTRFDEYNLKLTAALGAGKPTAELAYEIPELSKYLDHLQLMAYDFHGKWDKVTGHNTPLFADKGEYSVESSVDYYLSQGADPGKLVLGLAAYGRTFLLANETILKLRGEDHGGFLGSPSSGRGFQGPWTKEDGFMGYNEICKELKSDRGEWEMYWDKEAKVPFMRNGAKWMSFDNPQSLREKVLFATSRGLKGVMIWSIDTDDVRGICGGAKYPLLRAINSALTEPPPINPNEIDTSAAPSINPINLLAILIPIILKNVLISSKFFNL